MSCGVGRRHGSDLVLLWLWCRLAATSPIRLLAWEPPWAVDVAIKKTKNLKEAVEGRDLDMPDFPCVDGDASGNSRCAS